VDLIVYKFGGTSLGDAVRFRSAAALVAGCEEPPVVVVSAVAGVTNRLETLAAPASDARERAAGTESLRQLHHGIARELLGADGGDPEALDTLGRRLDAILDAAGETLAGGPPDEAGGAAAGGAAARFLDAVCAAGEDLSVQLMVAALTDAGLPAVAVDARAIVRTDSHHGRAIPADEETYLLAREKLGPILEEGRIPVLQGFVGATEEGTTTTLGRGGSDFTAAIIGAALGATEVSIWTDVDGIFSADPNQIPDARILRVMGFEEAVELAWFGARVIHPAAAKHAVARDVSLRVRNSFRPDDPGTLILHDRREAPKLGAVACKPSVTLLRVRSRPLFMAHGFLARVFGVLSAHHLPVDLVATSHSSTAFTIDEDEELEAVIAELDAFAEVEVVRNLATVSVVGRGLMGVPGTTGKILATLREIPVYLVSQASDVTLSFLVAERDGVEAARRIHRELVIGASEIRGELA
jgi:aspartate kinase